MIGEQVLPDAWLQRVGFRLGNPFSTREAAAEPESALIEYFIPHPAFEQVAGSALSPHSTVLVAKRGCGKTTTRRVLEWQCAAGQLDAPVLAVLYTDFSRSLRYADENGRVSIDHHVVAILRAGMLQLFNALADNPERCKAFVGGLRSRFAQYLYAYTSLLSDDGLDEWLQERESFSEDVQTSSLRAGNVPPNAPFLSFLATLLTINREAWNPTEETAVELLRRFVRLVNLAGFRAVFCLVDRVDEREPMASDPEKAAALLVDLITDLPLMELRDIAFKYFVTPAVFHLLEQHPAYRKDRIRDYHIYWSEEDLQYLLDRRVAVFTEGALPSLDAASKEGNLVRPMAAAAQGSPRNMLRLAGWLLFFHHQRTGNNGDFVLLREDLDKALARFREEQTTVVSRPILELVPEAPIATPSLPKPAPAVPETSPLLYEDAAGDWWYQQRRIGPLPKKQRLLLSYLLENQGRVCTYEMIGAAVHGDDFIREGLTNGSIDKLVQRLRKQLTLKQEGPIVIRKVMGINGYILEWIPHSVKTKS